MSDKPEGYKQEVANYLELLRRSGETNMYGASPFLVAEFGVDRKVASAWLVHWMKTYRREDYANLEGDAP